MWSVRALGKDTAPTRGLSPSARGRGATCQLRPPRASRLSRRTRGRVTALAISREEAQHASLLGMRHVVLFVVGRFSRQGASIGERPLSVGVWTWYDVPAAASQTHNQLAFARHARARSCARCLSRGGAARELAARARRAVPVVVSACSMKEYCTGERPLSFGALPWCNVPAVATKNQPAFARHARARSCARCLSRGGAARELAARARRAAVVVVSPCSIKGTVPARGLSHSTRGRGATCQR